MGNPFESLPQKIAVVPIAITALGWLLVVIGFGIATVEEDAVDRSQPETYPLWMVSLCGPFIIISALAHAALWQPLSSRVGAITSFLSVLFLTALGMILYDAGNPIRIANDAGLGGAVPAWRELMFSGAVIATGFLTITMILWIFYAGFSKSVASSGESIAFQGVARKTALPFIILTALAWLLILIGFGIGTNINSADDRRDIDPRFFVGHIRDETESYLYWVVCITGPFVFVTAFLHAGLWNPIGPYLGSITVVLNAFFLTGLGMILFANGNTIRRTFDANESRSETFKIDIPTFYALEFSGALLATLFWAPVMILWHFYDGDSKEA